MTIRKSPLAAFQAVSTQIKGKVTSGGPSQSNYFPHWNIPMNSSATLRFLPDRDETRIEPWVEKRTIKVPYVGVIGGDYPSDDPVQVSVVSPETFGIRCPITELIRPLWTRSEADKEVARTLYRKISHIMQGFVVHSPLADLTPPASGIWKFTLNKSISEIVIDGAMDPDRMACPWDPDDGADFVITKTQNGSWASYVKSKYSLRSRGLNEVERAAVETHGLYNLADELGPKPDATMLAALKQMGQDSLDGKPFDADRFGPLGFRAYRVNDYGATAAAPMASRTEGLMAQLTGKNRSAFAASGQ